ncbi:MAG: helix-turn-helix transcriptional regulator [Actinomycetota bacterium]
MLSPLVGREEELERLRAWQAELSGAGRLVVVAGEAGVGKSRLIEEALDDRQLLLKVAFPRARFAVPGHGIRMLSHVEAEGAEVLRSRLDAPDRGGSGRAEIWLAANDILARAAPCAVVLDDLQWADELTLGWLAQAYGLLQNTPVFIVAGVRAVGQPAQHVWEALDRAFRSGCAESLTLRPLGIVETADLAAAMGHDTSGAFVSRLHERTDGVPLAVVELLGRLDREGGAGDLEMLERLSASADLPLVASVVRDQLNEVGDDAMRVLAVAALLPQPAADERILAVLEWPKRRLDAALDAAAEAGLVEPTGSGGVAFRHDLQRQSIQDQLALADARALHEDIARVLANSAAPASQVAHHFFEAGEHRDAAVWFERAATEATRVHDHGNAVHHLGAALDLVSDDETRIRLSDRVARAARASERVEEGLEVLDRAMGRVAGEAARGRLLLARARLVAYSGGHERRMADLLAARDALTGTQDRAGMALVLGELALPVGGPLTLDERVKLGREGLELAEASTDLSAISLCAGNLAAAEIMRGNRRAFQLWNRAIEVSEPTDGGGPTPEALRNAINWATGALAFGDYATAIRVIEQHLDPVTDPALRSNESILRALHEWRIGNWDHAVEKADNAAGSHRPEYRALARLIASGVSFERDPRPDIASLVDATTVLTELTEEDWGPLALAVLSHARAERREPNPCRGVVDLVDRVVRTGTRVGWDDLLPATARLDPRLCNRILLLIGDKGPRGPRADAAMALTRGLLLPRGSAEAEALLIEAADRYEGLPEPYQQARALEAAAAARLLAGGKAGALRVRAAEIYSELGAQRSLASLLRRSGGSRALSRFKVPASHAHRPSPGLTPREMEVAQLARLGHPAREIAANLGVSTFTVQKHLERIKSKLGVARKSDLVRLLAD